MILNLRLEVPDDEPEPDLAAARILREAAETMDVAHRLDRSFGVTREVSWGPINCVWSWRGEQNLDLLGKR